MREPRRDPNLPAESLGSDSGGELPPQHLQSDRAAVLEVRREVHRRHRAFAEQAFHAVRVADRRRECGIHAAP